jgi:hypothetical protein
MSDRTHPRVRKWSLVLSSLSLTPDAGLEVFRDRRAADPRLPVERLRKARAILDAAAQAVESAEAGRWSRLEQAYELLARDAAFDPGATFDEPAPPGPMRSASEAMPDAKPSAAQAVATSSGPSPAFEPLPSAPPLAVAFVAAPTAPQSPKASSRPEPSIPLSSPGPLQPPSAPLPAEPVIVARPVSAPPRQAFTGAMAAFPDSASQLPFARSSPPSVGQRAARPRDETPGTVLPFGQKGGAAASPVAGTSAGPASSRGATVPPSLTVAQFASFVVEREVYSAKRDEVRARYGIPSPESEEALDEGFRGRFARDPGALRVFEDVRARYRAWLATRG